MYNIESDLAELATDAQLAYEECVATGIKCRELQSVMSKISFAKEVIKSQGLESYLCAIDPHDILNINKIISDDKLMDAQVESLSDAFKAAWEKARNFFTRIWNMMKRMYNRLVNANAKTEEYIDEIQQTIDNAEVQKSVQEALDSEKNGSPVATMQDIRVIGRDGLDYLTVYTKYLDGLDVFYKKIEGFIDSNIKLDSSHTQELDSQLDAIKTITEDLKAKSIEIKKKREEAAQHASDKKSAASAGFTKPGIFETIKIYRSFNKSVSSVQKKEESLNSTRERLLKKSQAAAAESLSAQEGVKEVAIAAGASLLVAYLLKGDALQSAVLKWAVTGGTLGLMFACIKFTSAAISTFVGFDKSTKG